MHVTDYKMVYYDPWDAQYLSYLVAEYDEVVADLRFRLFHLLINFIAASALFEMLLQSRFALFAHKPLHIQRQQIFYDITIYSRW